MSQSPRDYASVRILTAAGWVIGRMAHAPGTSAIDHLNGPPEADGLLKLRQVALPGRMLGVEFFALSRHAALVVVPDRDAQVPPPAPGEAERQVACLLEVGTLHGTLALPAGLRMSDHLLGHQGFLVMRSCRLRGTATDEGASSYPVAYLNAARLIGMSERSD